MKCDKCNNESVFEVQIFTENGNKIIRLCKDCYFDYMKKMWNKNNTMDMSNIFGDNFNFNDKDSVIKAINQVMGSLVGDITEKTFNNLNKNNEDKAEDKICKFCKTSYKDIKKTGELGCEHCYEEFSDELVDELFRHQTSITNRGRVPKKFQKIENMRYEIEGLNGRLQDLVMEENYEQAAIIRDEIKKIREDIVRVTGEINE